MATEDKPKFTPGPWECVPSIPEDGFECFWIRARRDFGPLTRGFRVVDIGSVNGPQWIEQKANAHAISAVPEMYEALEQSEACMSIVEPRSDKAEYLRILDVVRAALAKAEGRQS